jgi:hypothetical protein
LGVLPELFILGGADVAEIAVTTSSAAVGKFAWVVSVLNTAAKNGPGPFLSLFERNGPFIARHTPS